MEYRSSSYVVENIDLTSTPFVSDSGTVVNVWDEQFIDVGEVDLNPEEGSQLTVPTSPTQNVNFGGSQIWAASLDKRTSAVQVSVDNLLSIPIPLGLGSVGGGIPATLSFDFRVYDADMSGKSVKLPDTWQFTLDTTTLFASAFVASAWNVRHDEGVFIVSLVVAGILSAIPSRPKTIGIGYNIRTDDTGLPVGTKLPVHHTINYGTQQSTIAVPVTAYCKHCGTRKKREVVVDSLENDVASSGYPSNLTASSSEWDMAYAVLG